MREEPKTGFEISEIIRALLDVRPGLTGAALNTLRFRGLIPFDDSNGVPGRGSRHSLEFAIRLYLMFSMHQQFGIKIERASEIASAVDISDDCEPLHVVTAGSCSVVLKVREAACVIRSRLTDAKENA